MDKRPKVGIGVFVLKDNKILLGKRIGKHGEGTWGLPGGHLEFGEQFEECSQRETLEETGVKIKNIKFGTITNDIHKVEEKHYVTIFMVSEYDSGTVKVMEPDKFEKWDWFEWDNLPKPLFLPLVNLKNTNFSPFDIA